MGSVAIVERAVQARRSAVEAAPTSTLAIGRSTSSVVSPTSRTITATAVFERNDGQAPAAYRYLARHVEHEFAFAPGAIAITVADGAGSSSVALRFDGGRAAEPAAEAPLAGRVNYLRRRAASAWVTDIPTFERVRYANVYRGIDAVFYAAGGRVEYDLVVQPHADPSSIVLAFDGASAVRLAEGGDLVVETSHGKIVQRRPSVYQTSGDRRVPVPASYGVDGGRVSLALGSYDPAKMLIIDPVIAYATDYGASSADYVQAVAADAAGSLYAAGTTQSATLPMTAGAYDTTLAPHDARTSVAQDAFVMKLSADGTKLIYATYLGGTGVDGAMGIAVDATGYAYIAGATTSTDFPTTAGAFDRFCGGSCQSLEGFVAKLTPSGNALVYSTYLGGASQDEPFGIAVNAAGEAVVAGQACSADFPITPGAFQQQLHSSCDGFVTRFAANGATLLYSTFYGGSATEDVLALALDAGGNAYIAGVTASRNLVVPRAFQPAPAAPAGTESGFVAKFSPSGSLLYGSYLGGTAGTFVYSVAVGSDGLFLAGVTSSKSLPGGSLAASRGGAAFVTQVAADLSHVLTTRFIDGGGEDFVRAVVADGTHTVHLTGGTRSTDLPITIDAMQTKHAGPVFAGGVMGTDTFYATLPIATTGVMSAPSYLTYLGGASDDDVSAMAGDGKGGVFIGGSNAHHDFPLVNARFRGASGRDGFIAHLVPTAAFRVANNHDMVLYADDAIVIINDTHLVADPTAAIGRAMLMPDHGVTASPVPYPGTGFDLKFYAIAGIPYRVWIRGRAQNNSTANDSVWLQFSDSVDANGNPIWRMLTNDAMAISLEECAGCGVSGWGWHDDGWGAGVRGPAVYFKSNGYHTVRIQAHEDGLAIDQVIISSRAWLTAKPGAPKNSTNVYPRSVIP
ncbi:MAG: hypothetical protein DMF93_13250 [Acidobacteria bacterium]|nr:MAG: hypothetical protein DMF93_13250 [Acidobacteriota bacterium]